MKITGLEHLEIRLEIPKTELYSLCLHSILLYRKPKSIHNLEAEVREEKYLVFSFRISHLIWKKRSPSESEWSYEIMYLLV